MDVLFLSLTKWDNITCGCFLYVSWTYITDYISDDEDINRKRRTLFVQGNIILNRNIAGLPANISLIK